MNIREQTGRRQLITTSLCKIFIPSLALYSHFQVDKESAIRVTSGDKGVQNAGYVMKAKGFFLIKNPQKK